MPTAEKQKTSRREVLGVFVSFKALRKNALGDERIGIVTADRGEIVDLFEDDEARLDSLDMLVPKGSSKNAGQLAEELRQRAISRAVSFDREGFPEPIPVETPQAPLADRAGLEPIGQDGSLEAARRAGSGDVEGVAEFITAEKPNAQDTVALAGDDPGRARVVYDAENAAHGGDGRVTVLEPLQKIIDQS
jgi:hypothetical protein